MAHQRSISPPPVPAAPEYVALLFSQDFAVLPTAPFELPLVIQDRRVARDDRLVYAGGMMDSMNGVLGDVILVNGRVNAVFPVSPRTYRLRVLNASNARIYKLAWSDGEPITVIGTDGGYLSADEGIQTRAYVTLAPSERVDFVEDFSRRRPGDRSGESALCEWRWHDGARDDGTRHDGRRRPGE